MKINLSESVVRSNHVSLIVAFFSIGAIAQANPTGATVVTGSATFSEVGNTLTVNQTTDRAVINWESFSIANGQTTAFTQLSATSVVLNRVTGNNLSEIHGTLSANGQVYLLNENGVLVGENGMIQTSGFVASTHNLSDSDFMAGGNLSFTPGMEAGAIINLGQISVTGGDVFLIADQVTNGGSIVADDGIVGFAAAAGADVLLSESGFQSLVVQPSTTVTSIDGIVNSGSIAALNAELTAADGNVYALGINNNGAIRATGVDSRGGRILLTAKSSNIELGASSQLDASLDGGGEVIITAGNTATLAGIISATGDGVAGDIKVTALENITVGALIATGDLRLSAQTDGLGGTINLVADNTTIDIDGDLTADAGGQGLDDFFIIRNNGGTGIGEDATAGDINLTVSNGGRFEVSGASNFLAVGQGGKGELQNGSAQGGNITVELSDAGSQIILVGASEFNSGTLRSGNGKIGGNGPGEIGSDSVGGTVNLNLSGGTLTAGAVIVNNNGIGSSGSDSSITQSNDATAGIVNLTVTGGTHSVTDLTINTNADDGDSYDAAGNKVPGLVSYGQTNVLVDNSTLNISNNLTIIGQMTGTTFSTPDEGAVTITTVSGDPDDVAVITASNGGAINTTGAFTVDTAGNAELNVDATSQVVSGNTSLTSGNDILINHANSIVLGTLSSAGNLEVSSSGAITDSGILTVGGETTLTAGAANDITLDSANDFMGAVAVVSGKEIALNDINALSLGDITAAGTLNATAQGAISQTVSSLIVAGDTTLSAGAANDITLDNANDFTGLVSVTSGNNVSLNDSNSITLGSMAVSGGLDVSAVTDITVSEAIAYNSTEDYVLLAGQDLVLGVGATLSNAGAGNLILNAGGHFHNDSGSLTPLATTTGRTLIYSSRPDLNRNDLEMTNLNFLQFGQSFSAATPIAAGLPAGDGLIFHETPTITTTANNQTITYGTTTPNTTTTQTAESGGSAITLADWGFSASSSASIAGGLTGVQDADTFVDAYIAATSLTGTGGRNIAGVTISNVDGSLIVDQKALSIIGVSAEDKIYDTTTGATFTGGSLDGLVSGDTVNLTVGTGSFADHNVGTGIAVSAIGYGITGTDAGNYVITGQPTGLSADITAAGLNIIGVSAEDKLYDGTTHVLLNGGVIDGGFSGDDLSVVAGTGAYVDASIGTNKSIVVSGYTIAGADAGNYQLLAQPNAGAGAVGNVLPLPEDLNAESTDDLLVAIDQLAIALDDGKLWPMHLQWLETHSAELWTLLKAENAAEAEGRTLSEEAAVRLQTLLSQVSQAI